MITGRRERKPTGAAAHKEVVHRGDWGKLWSSRAGRNGKMGMEEYFQALRNGPQVDDSPDRFARTPWEVLMDPYLSWVTKGVYAYMAAHTYDGCKVSMPSNGSVAQTLGISRPMVSDSIRYLIARGHVKRLGTGADGTYLYKLTSRIFEKKRKEGRS